MPPNLDEAEETVKLQTLKEHRHELAVLESMLNTYLASFRAISSFTRTEDNDAEYVWFLLTNHCFNSMRWAYHLLSVGYYHQAFILIRSVCENWLVCMDSLVTPKTISAFLDGEPCMPRFSDMANRLPEPLMKWWKDNDPAGSEGTYGFLSTFAHPRKRLARTMVNPDSKTIKLGPDYDAALFVTTAYYLAFASIRMAEFVYRLLGSEQPTAGLETAIKETTELLGKLTQDALNMMETQ